MHVYSGSCLEPDVIAPVTAWPDTSCLLVNRSEAIIYCILGHAYPHLGQVESSAHHTLLHLAADDTKCIMCIQVCNFLYMHLLSPVHAWSRDPSKPCLECCRGWLLAMNPSCWVSNFKYQMKRLTNKMTWVRIICNEQGLMLCVCACTSPCPTLTMRAANRTHQNSTPHLGREVLQPDSRLV